jgi:HK97 family phage major capsid protein
MSVSLSKIDQKISAKKREISSLVAKRQEAFEAIDTLSDAIDALNESDPSDDQKAQLKSKIAEHRTARALRDEISESVRAAEDELFELKKDREACEEHNRAEASLRDASDRQGTPDSVAPAAAPAANVRVQDLTGEQKDHDIASLFRGMYLGKAEGVGLRAVLSGEVGDQYRNDRMHAAVTKTTNSNIFPDGYVPRLIELLRPRTVIRQMDGIRQMSMPNGALRIPRQNATTNAQYVGELTEPTLANPTTNEVTLASKKLMSIVVQSGEVMRQSSPSSDRMILNDVVAQVARKEDATFLRGTQSATVPGGLKYFADNGGFTTAANGTVNVANVTTDIGKLILGLVNEDVPMLNPYFVMAPRTERWLMDARDGNGNYAFPELQLGNLRGFPYLTTTQIPINLGGGTNASELYLVDASEFILAEAPTFELTVSMEAAYDDGGTVKAAFSQDAAVFRLITEHDTEMRHRESVGYLSGVTWGV